MKHLLSTLSYIIILLAVQKSYGQTIPTGTCGLQYTYDASGNTISRQYVCVTAFTPQNEKSSLLANSKGIGLKPGQTAAIQPIDILYTPKETGVLSLIFDKELRKVPVSVIDKDGKLVKGLSINGALAVLDLSGLKMGNYMLMISSDQLRLSQKIIKL